MKKNNKTKQFYETLISSYKNLTQEEDFNANKMSENIKDRVRVTYIWDNELLNYKDSPIDKDKKTFEKLIKNRRVI